MKKRRPTLENAVAGTESKPLKYPGQGVTFTNFTTVIHHDNSENYNAADDGDDDDTHSVDAEYPINNAKGIMKYIKKTSNSVIRIALQRKNAKHKSKRRRKRSSVDAETWDTFTAAANRIIGCITM